MERSETVLNGNKFYYKTNESENWVYCCKQCGQKLRKDEPYLESHHNFIIACSESCAEKLRVIA